MFVVSSCRLRVSSLSFLRNCPVSLRLAGMAVRSEIPSEPSVSGWKASAADRRE